MWMFPNTSPYEFLNKCRFHSVRGGGGVGERQGRRFSRRISETIIPLTNCRQSRLSWFATGSTTTDWSSECELSIGSAAANFQKMQLLSVKWTNRRNHWDKWHFSIGIRTGVLEMWTFNRLGGGKFSENATPLSKMNESSKSLRYVPFLARHPDRGPRNVNFQSARRRQIFRKRNSSQ